MEVSAEARRVLGCLVEKAMVTPNQYPLSINALVTAANQRTGRDPVVDYTEDDVRAGLDDLKANQLVRNEYARGSRVPKYAHRFEEQLDLDDPQMALLALLLLRGPQTVGELRSRSERMHDFAGLDDVQRTLESLAAHRFGPLVEEMPRQPGQKETRWRHLLGPDDQVTVAAATAADPVAAEPGLAQRIAALEARVVELDARVAALEARLAADVREPGG